MYTGVPPVPDHAFVRRLREFDPELYVEFDRAMERFVIRQRAKALQRPLDVIVVQSDDGDFRQPDSRELKALFGSDIRRISLEERQRRSADYMRDYKDRQERNAADDLMHATRLDKIQLVKTYQRAANEGKGTSVGTFRPVRPRPHGKVFGKEKEQ